MRAGEPPEHRRRRAHLAVLDPRQGGAAHSAPRGKLIERPAPRPPQRAQALGEAQVGGVVRGGESFHNRKILSKTRASRRERPQSSQSGRTSVNSTSGCAARRSAKSIPSPLTT